MEQADQQTTEVANRKPAPNGPACGVSPARASLAAGLVANTDHPGGPARIGVVPHR